MASLRVNWVRNHAGKLDEQLLSSNQIRVLNKKCFVGYPNLLSRQGRNINQGRCRSVMINGSGDRVNTTVPRPSEFDGLMSSYPTYQRWREIGQMKPMKKRGVVDKDEDLPAGTLDQWVKDSVPEIVSNIGEAPFLVHIYSDGAKNSSPFSPIRLVREKADSDTWPLIKGRWEMGGSPTPNGVILVEELTIEEELEHEQKFDNTADFDSQLHSTNKVWGVLVQGKGDNCTACYLLKTCRVQSVSGFCTHFCLVRLNCLLESAEIQLKNLWLQR